MAIICEGPDGSGKTTLANFIAKEFNLEVHHSGGPVNTQAEYRQRLNDLDDLDTPTVLDRHVFFSEYIYGPLFGRNVINPVDWATERKPFFKQHMIIFCKAPTNAVPVQANPKFDTPEYVEQLRTHHVNILLLYDRLFRDYPPDVTFNWLNTRKVLKACSRYLG